MRELPPEVERLLLEVAADGFTLYCCGPRTAPIALAASYDWGDCIDHLTIWSWDRVTAARTPQTLGPVDVFAPEMVVWSYEGPAEHAVRALLSLVPPQHPDAPVKPYPAPASLHIPRYRQRPMSIKLPSPSQAGARETRLIRAAIDDSVRWTQMLDRDGAALGQPPGDH